MDRRVLNMARIRTCMQTDISYYNTIWESQLFIPPSLYLSTNCWNESLSIDMLIELMLLNSESGHKSSGSLVRNWAAVMKSNLTSLSWYRWSTPENKFLFYEFCGQICVYNGIESLCIVCIYFDNRKKVLLYVNQQHSSVT